MKRFGERRWKCRHRWASSKLRFLPGAQSGQRLRLKGKGVSAHGQSPAGDLYLRLMIRVPGDNNISADVIDKIDRAYAEDVRKDVRL